MIKWGVYWLVVAALVPFLYYQRPFDGGGAADLIAGPAVAASAPAEDAAADSGRVTQLATDTPVPDDAQSQEATASATAALARESQHDDGATTTQTGTGAPSTGTASELSTDVSAQTLADVGGTHGRVFVTTGRVNYRTGPGTRFKRMGSFPKGASLQVEAEEDGWLMFLTESGARAYVHGDYLQPLQP